MGNCALHVRYTVKPGMRSAFVKDVLDSGLLDKVRRENSCLEYRCYCSAKKESLALLLKMDFASLPASLSRATAYGSVDGNQNRSVQKTHVEKLD